ncbi:MAG: phosphoribosylformylglycinamidine synthase II [Omnitrophica WOR_2 bacterium RIFCSPHIGHO2_02_FULL_45_21]|nr:MAG: phosphoribosylformylglycinamidine synthase II [Omnitrophica WOR_2 bacterium RIFCSPHIGHO2_02_FULL_45_21]
MIEYQIKVSEKEGVFDAMGQGVLRDIQDLGIKNIADVHYALLYYLSGDIDAAQLRRIIEELLIDKITQEYSMECQGAKAPRCQDYRTIEVAYNPGVMDPVEESVLKAIADMGISGVGSVRTAKEYTLKGSISEGMLNTIAEKLLYNKVIQHITGRKTSDERRRRKGEVDYKFKLITVNLLAASDKKLREISRNGQLFLNLSEMRQIRNYFKKLGRNPTDCELETIAQTWSEHCWHKTFRGRIEYTEQIANRKSQIAKKSRITKSNFKTKIINNLLKSTIMRVTKELAKPWCVSVFEDNSGVIKFDHECNVCFKVETHNHPSALEPFGGANTGIGGVIRDPMGTGLGAKPIFNTDIFCFGPPDYPYNRLPRGVFHPKRIAKAVVSGVRDYGNKMGIPTVNGAVIFDQGYLANPLVYCGTAGIMPKAQSFKKVKTGYLIVVVGGRTGRDGIHGATFSSGELTDKSEELSSGAVQIGNPITEKKMLDTLLSARDKELYSAITDCGAGGLSSAVGEMGKDLGARVDLAKVPLKYQGLTYAEIWISEAQERMVLAVPEENKDALLKLFADENVEATVIGEFTNSKRLELFYGMGKYKALSQPLSCQGNLVCDLEMKFLHAGPAQLTKKAIWKEPKHKEPDFECPQNLTKILRKLLGHYNIASKEWIIRQYDHEVQGGSVLKPLVGIVNDGPSDAAIVRPRLESNRGIIVSCGINFRFGLIDPYWMAASCIDEALRQIIAVGGSLKELALLDNFCWGNPDKPDRLGSLVRAADGCYKIAKGFGVPFISGKDSLYNEYSSGGKSKAIPGTLLISSIAVMDDVRKAVSMDAKKEGDLIYILGDTHPELGGSHYFDILGFMGNNLPKVNVKRAKFLMDKLSRATSRGLVRAAHDCSEGGLGVALAEMAFSGGLGMDVFLREVPYKTHDTRGTIQEARNDFVLFSESNSRFVVEVEKTKQKEFEQLMQGASWGLIGCLQNSRDFRVYGLNSRPCIEADIYDLKEAWQRPLRW